MSDYEKENNIGNEQPNITHILVVDDDRRLRKLICKYLADQGWIATEAKNADDARVKMEFFLFDAMVLDVMMPGETGYELAISLGKQEHPPILMLTAMSEVEDRIEGLEAGADDYLAKPFEPKELLLRLRAIIRRSAKNDTEDELNNNSEITFGEFAFDRNTETLSQNGEPIYLTSVEIKIISKLTEKPNSPVSRENISQAISVEGEEISLRTVDVNISRLRKKIEQDPARPRYLQTVRSKGYRLCL